MSVHDPLTVAEQNDAVASSAEILEHALFEAKRVLVGQDRMIERLFVSWLAN